ncbi:MAG: hypothetical protein AAF742_00950, partial [Pseudomonadota bacterium]
MFRMRVGGSGVSRQVRYRLCLYRAVKRAAPYEGPFRLVFTEEETRFYSEDVYGAETNPTQLSEKWLGSIGEYGFIVEDRPCWLSV